MAKTQPKDEKPRSFPTMGRPNRPAWIKQQSQASAEPKDEICPNRAAAVLWMFQASANGLIDLKIAELMPEHFHPWAKNMSLWTIRRILKDRAVLGEYQRYRMIDGQRRPAGQPEQNRFPRIVPTELFDRVQKARSLPRTGDLANLFADVGKCENCHQPMKRKTTRVKNKDPESVLYCDNKICGAVGVEWPYNDFARMFDLFAKKIDDGSLIKEQRLDDLAAIDLEIKFLQDNRNAKRAEIELLKNRIVEINEQIAKARLEKRGRRSVGGGRQLRAVGGDYRLGSRKKERIRENVRELYIAAAGTGPRLEKRIELIKKTKTEPPDFTEYLIRQVEELKNVRFVTATFEDGREVVGIPNPNDPDGIEVSEAQSRPVEPGQARVWLGKDGLPPVPLLILFSIPDLPGGQLKMELAPGGWSCANDMGSISPDVVQKT